MGTECWFFFLSFLLKRLREQIPVSIYPPTAMWEVWGFQVRLKVVAKSEFSNIQLLTFFLLFWVQRVQSPFCTFSMYLCILIKKITISICESYGKEQVHLRKLCVATRPELPGASRSFPERCVLAHPLQPVGPTDKGNKVAFSYFFPHLCLVFTDGLAE